MENIASNGKQIAFTTSNKGNSIHVIDFVTGQLIWKVDMVMPIGICYGPNTDTVMVAGGSTKLNQFVINQFCSKTGRLISRLASGLHNPYAMTAGDNKLFVADRKTVKVYKIELQ